MTQPVSPTPEPRRAESDAPTERLRTAADVLDAIASMRSSHETEKAQDEATAVLLRMIWDCIDPDADSLQRDVVKAALAVADTVLSPGNER